jgi:hypothetical protein
MTDLTDLAQQFIAFAQRECEASPLYRQLATSIAGDADLLSLAASGEYGPKPNLFLAAVHFLLLSGIKHPLAEYYLSITGSPVTGDVFPLFRSFCVRHRDEVLTVVESHRVQTNEPGRCAYLVPSLFLIAQRVLGQPLALIEVGAAAGLLLLYDHFAYDFGNGRQIGDLAALRIDCELAGACLPSLPSTFPTIVERLGIDLNPLDVRDPEAVRWLQALVWPDQPERADRLRQAIAVVQNHAPTLIAGDALSILPRTLETISADAVPCVMHAHTLNQFTPAARERFHNLLAEHSFGRDVYRLSLEGKYGPHAQLELSVYSQGALRREVLLAEYHPHGGWIEWVYPHASL